MLGRRRAVVGFVVLAVVASGCGTLLRSLKGTVEAPRAQLEEAKLGAVSLDDVTVVATFVVTNPNLVAVQLAKTDFAFSLDGKKIFEGSAPSGLDLPAGGRAKLTLPVKVPWSAVPDLVTTFASKNEAPYVVQGRVGVKTPIGDLPLPIKFGGTVPIPKLPKVSLGTARVDEMSLAGARVLVRLDVDNPNVFGLPLDALLGSVKIAGQPVAQLGLAAARPLEAGKTTPVEIPVNVSFVSAGMAVASALSSRSATVEVAGEAKVAGRSLPLSLSTSLR